MFAKGWHRPQYLFGSANHGTRGHDVNLATITLHGYKSILRMVCQILKIGQAAIGDSGRIQMVDIRLAGMVHKGL